VNRDDPQWVPPPGAALCLALLLSVTPALAVLGSAEPPPEVVIGDPDYKAGVEALQQEDWREVIQRMARVIERRPWDDNAHNLMAFAFRNLRDYPRALAHYREALELNPHHRGALEYLGEAYLAMGQPGRARQMLERLATECRRVGFGRPEQIRLEDCEEWQLLQSAIAAHPPVPTNVPLTPPEPGAWSAFAPESLDGLDTATLQLSDQGLYRASFRSTLEPVAINRMHSWVLHLETLEGHPVEAASIRVSGGMPEHNHGLPTVPRVTSDLGDGDYLVEGMKFQMNGWWVVTFTIKTTERSDDVTFNLAL
jgi:tetratricopeptide (TPR) repeat protein